MEDLNSNNLNTKNSIFVIFPSDIFSGHERMAIKILERIPSNKIIYISSKLENLIIENSELVYFTSKFSLIKSLFFNGIKNNNSKIFLISGSPFAYPFLKLCIKLFRYYLIEYVPMPELPNMKDKFHHNFMPFINKVLINKRVLIDNWQIKYSSVKNVLVIKNIV